MTRPNWNRLSDALEAQGYDLDAAIRYWAGRAYTDECSCTKMVAGTLLALLRIIDHDPMVCDECKRINEEKP